MEVEQKLIAGLIDSPVNLDEVCNKLTVDMFAERECQIVYQSLIDLYTKNKGIDTVTIHKDLATKGLSKEIDLVKLANWSSFVTLDVIVEYANIIVERWIRRSLLAFSDKLQFTSQDERADAMEVLNDLYNTADKIYEGVTSQESYSTFNEELTKAVKDIDQERKGGMSGVPSGLIDLDQITNGFQSTDLIILAARPGMGKSALMTTAMSNAAMRGFSVAVFSLEMSKFQIICRIISEQVGISSNELVKRNLSEYQRKLFREQINNIRLLPIVINDNTSLTITGLKAQLKQMKKHQDVDICFVDYLQLMTGDGGGNREQEISRISRGLKELAKDLKIPIIALSQLSRRVDEREGHRPYLSDLRESGSIEQDADMVLFLYRPYYYIQQRNEDEEYLGQKHEAFINVAKHRAGDLANVRVRFDGAHSKFYDEVAQDVAPY